MLLKHLQCTSRFTLLVVNLNLRGVSNVVFRGAHASTPKLLCCVPKYYITLILIETPNSLKFFVIINMQPTLLNRIYIVFNSFICRLTYPYF